MRPTVFHPLAETDFAEGVEFYAKRSRRLAAGFADAVDDALAFVRSRPEAGTPLRGGLRSWLLRRFPYRLIYREEPDRIYILAVAHHRRRPEYWRDRS